MCSSDLRHLDLTRNELIEKYFEPGLNYTEILSCLLVSHGISFSLRQLKRVLVCKGLRKRKNNTDLTRVLTTIQEELDGSGRSICWKRS